MSNPPVSLTQPNGFTSSMATKFATTDPQGQFCFAELKFLSMNSCTVHAFHQKSGLSSGKTKQANSFPVTRRWAQMWLGMTALSHSETLHVQTTKGNIQVQHHPSPKVEFSSTSSKQSWKAKIRMKKPNWGKEENTIWGQHQYLSKWKFPGRNIKLKRERRINQKSFSMRISTRNKTKLAAKQETKWDSRNAKERFEKEAFSPEKQSKNILFSRNTFYKNHYCLTKKRLNSDYKTHVPPCQQSGPKSQILIDFYTAEFQSQSKAVYLPSGF